MLFIFFAPRISAAENYFSNGTLLQGSGPEVFVLENGIKRHILNPRVFNGLFYDWNMIVKVTDEIFKNYPTGDEVSGTSKFLDGTLIKGSGPEVYLIKSGSRRWIPDPMTFNNLGFNWQNIITIPNDKLKGVWESNKLSSQTQPIKYPETFIVGNPAAVFETNEVTFEFSGTTVLGEPSSLSFETFVEGFDKGWQSAWSAKRTTKFPSSPAFYTFFVRAKDKEGNYDPMPAKFSFQVKISPYFDKIDIESRNIKKSDVNEEYLSLYNSSSDAIDIAAWILDTKKESKKIYLPGDYDNPNINRQDNLNIPGGGRVYIFSRITPVSWKSFRLNKCTGYLNNAAQFYLPLPNKCPGPPDEDLDDLSLNCQKFIGNLSSCEEPTSQKIIGLENDCQNYIRQNLNYPACIKNNKDRVDFLEKIWYVYLGKDSQIWRDDTDIITLRDKDGLKVAEYSY